MPHAEVYAERRERVAAADPSGLGYRERRCLQLYYGLGGEQARTLDEVGRTFNVTAERIRQILRRAEGRLP